MLSTFEDEQVSFKDQRSYIRITGDCIKTAFSLSVWWLRMIFFVSLVCFGGKIARKSCFRRTEQQVGAGLYSQCQRLVFFGQEGRKNRFFFFSCIPKYIYHGLYSLLQA